MLEITENLVPTDFDAFQAGITESTKIAASGLLITWNGSSPELPAHTARRRISLLIKRAMDVALSLSALIIFGPLLILTGLVIRLTSPGPALFKQPRLGLNGVPFMIYKFRSMRTDQEDKSGVAQTVVGDNRITPIGHFLRRTSIDELPQLLNILKGDMSIVGPRPQVSGQMAGQMLYEDLVPYYAMRHLMRPGLTGWAQANGLRGPTQDAVPSRQRIDHDMAYIQNFSVRLDISIILRTLKNEFVSGSGF